MKKIVSFFAFVAIMISFAACGGNEPEVKGFTFEVQTLSTKRHYVITPTNPNAYYIWNGWTYENCHEDEIQSKIEASLASGSFESLKGILKGESLESHQGASASPDTKYILYACYVEEDPVTHKGKMVGTPEYVIYQTMPEYTLNGEFTVDENGKKVRFSQGNYRKRMEHLVSLKINGVITVLHPTIQSICSNGIPQLSVHLLSLCFPGMNGGMC
jgi:hypothetical protein